MILYHEDLIVFVFYQGQNSVGLDNQGDVDQANKKKEGVVAPVIVPNAGIPMFSAR